MLSFWVFFFLGGVLSFYCSFISQLLWPVHRGQGAHDGQPLLLQGRHRRRRRLVHRAPHAMCSMQRAMCGIQPAVGVGVVCGVYRMCNMQHAMHSIPPVVGVVPFVLRSECATCNAPHAASNLRSGSSRLVTRAALCNAQPA